MGADGAEEGCDQPPAAGVRVLGLWDPIPPHEELAHQVAGGLPEPEEIGRPELEVSQEPGSPPGFLALFCREDGEGCPGGRGVRRGRQGRPAWHSALAQQGCPETPRTSEPSFLGTFHPHLFGRECGASFSSQVLKTLLIN